MALASHAKANARSRPPSRQKTCRNPPPQEKARPPPHRAAPRGGEPPRNWTVRRWTRVPAWPQVRRGDAWFGGGRGGGWGGGPRGWGVPGAFCGGGRGGRARGPFFCRLIGRWAPVGVRPVGPGGAGGGARPGGARPPVGGCLSSPAWGGRGVPLVCGFAAGGFAAAARRPAFRRGVPVVRLGVRGGGGGWGGPAGRGAGARRLFPRGPVRRGSVPPAPFLPVIRGVWAGRLGSCAPLVAPLRRRPGGAGVAAGPSGGHR